MFGCIGDEMTELKPVNDQQAQAARQKLEEMGSRHVLWFASPEGHRVCLSLDPSREDGGFERHASVSRYGSAVDSLLAVALVAQVAPNATWRVSHKSATAVHLHAQV